MTLTPNSGKPPDAPPANVTMHVAAFYPLLGRAEPEVRLPAVLPDERFHQRCWVAAEVGAQSSQPVRRVVKNDTRRQFRRVVVPIDAMRVTWLSVQGDSSSQGVLYALINPTQFLVDEVHPLSFYGEPTPHTNASLRA